MPGKGRRGSKVRGSRINWESLARKGSSLTGLVWNVTKNGGLLFYYEFWWSVKDKNVQIIRQN